MDSMFQFTVYIKYEITSFSAVSIYPICHEQDNPFLMYTFTNCGEYGMTQFLFCV